MDKLDIRHTSGAINIPTNAGHQNSDFDGTEYPTPLVMFDVCFHAT